MATEDTLRMYLKRVTADVAGQLPAAGSAEGHGIAAVGMECRALVVRSPQR